MFGIFLLIYFAAKNGNRARRKGLRPLLWAGITVVSFFLALIVGFYVVLLGFCRDQINMAAFSSPDPKVREQLTLRAQDLIGNNELHMATVLLFGIGGYLFVRYLLENRPDKKEPKAEAEVSSEPMQ